MSKLITHCPSCQKKDLEIQNILCLDCGTQFSGNFQIPYLLKLSQEDLHFILEFVKSSGNLKEIAKQLNISYPTLRNRLNSIIENIQELEKQTSLARNIVLCDLENGKINAKEAACKLMSL